MIVATDLGAHATLRDLHSYLSVRLQPHSHGPLDEHRHDRKNEITLSRLLLL